QQMIDRWNARQYTSVHFHGELEEWAEKKAAGEKQERKYPLVTLKGNGMSLPSARDKYVAECVLANRNWNDLTAAEKLETQEQAGVFACTSPAHAYWYG